MIGGYRMSGSSGSPFLSGFASMQAAERPYRIEPYWIIMAAILLALLVWSTNSAQGAPVEGFTEPNRTVHVAAASEVGLIRLLNVEEGDTVKKGQLLAKLDTNVLEASLAMARQRAASRGRLDAISSDLQLKHDRLAKFSKLAGKGHATAGELDRAKAELEIAEANLLASQEEKRLAELECRRIQAQLDRRHVRSPFDGVVTEVHREVGESVNISDPKLMTLVDLNPLRVKFAVNYEQLTQLQPGQAVSLFFFDTGQRVESVVKVISPVVHASSGTIQVTCLIDNQAGKYRAGLRCALEIAGSKPTPSTSPSPLDD